MIHTALTYTLHYNSKNNGQINADSITEIVTRIKLIGSIKEGEKLNVKNMCIQPVSLWTSISRMFYQESRDDTAHFISSSLNRAFEIINSKLNSNRVSDNVFCKNCIIDIKAAIIGIKNLQNTYTFDRRFCCFMETLIENTESQLFELYKARADIFPRDNSDIELLNHQPDIVESNIL